MVRILVSGAFWVVWDLWAFPASLFCHPYGDIIAWRNERFTKKTREERGEEETRGVPDVTRRHMMSTVYVVQSTACRSEHCQSLTSVSIKDCTLRVPNKTTTLFLLWAIIIAILIHVKFWHHGPLHIYYCHAHSISKKSLRYHLNFVWESREFISPYVRKFLSSETYKSQTSPRWNVALCICPGFARVCRHGVDNFRKTWQRDLPSWWGSPFNKHSLLLRQREPFFHVIDEGEEGTWQCSACFYSKQTPRIPAKFHVADSSHVYEWNCRVSRRSHRYSESVVPATCPSGTRARRRHTGYILMMMNGGPISWNSRRQDNVYFRSRIPYFNWPFNFVRPSRILATNKTPPLKYMRTIWHV